MYKIERPALALEMVLETFYVPATTEDATLLRLLGFNTQRVEHHHYISLKAALKSISVPTVIVNK